MAPKGHSTRPTADRVRQAIFNIIEHAAFAAPLAAIRAADLFAGSGALGLEALSRGAASCLFVDDDPAATSVVGRNLARLGLEPRARVLTGDARRLGRGPAFDLVFLDPPYGRGLAEEALAGLMAAARLAPGALAVVERGALEGAFQPPGFSLLAERNWGAAKVSFVRLA